MLGMAVVSQSIENSCLQEKRELPRREGHTLPNVLPKSHEPFLHIHAPGLRLGWLGGNIIVHCLRRSPAFVERLHERH